MWLISSMHISVTGKGKGEVSVKLVDDEDVTLSINKILVDLGNGAEPIQIMKYQGTPFVSGSFVDGLKEMILDIFQDDLKDRAVGLYQVNEHGIAKI